ncbi:hypothetical protein [Sulfurimonas sp. NW9]|uniref:hypothetical protein n=1 Tax=Sulfurimonas sp. NW9 TaxID=2922728 RepID=UPI003DA9301C
MNYTTDECSQGEKILVVGGGDSAVEYAVDLSEHNDVSICYRRRVSAGQILRIKEILPMRLHREMSDRF